MLCVVCEQQGAEDTPDAVAANIGNQMLVEQQDGTLLLYMDGDSHAAMQGAVETSMVQILPFYC
jgi:hypothetical protein